MMNKEKQIEEIKVLAEDILEEYANCYSEVDKDVLVEMIYNAGYRKQSEGEWMHVNNPNLDIYEHRPISVCSCCGFHRIGDTNFCENCGAKMKGGAE